ncbi:MAG: hypothetical protein J1E65_03835 [Lachnospiraceae bacterium]|nr:hypothetical protein [Lachnospiraceae bacterium]
MKLLYGTGNSAKLQSMRNRLCGLPVELIGLREIQEETGIVVYPGENGSTPLENARQKARAYYAAYKMPVFSCDSGLYCEELPDELQPGVHVRTVGGKYLSDEEMQQYYAQLAKRYGKLTARYHNAICLIMGEGEVYEKMDESLASETFILTDKVHPIKKKGFPLDSLSIHIPSGKFFYDLEEEAVNKVAVEDGFLLFFKEILQDRTPCS